MLSGKKYKVAFMRSGECGAVIRNRIEMTSSQRRRNGREGQHCIIVADNVSTRSALFDSMDNFRQLGGSCLKLDLYC